MFGKKSNHPLTDTKSAQDLLDGLPKQDALQYLADSWVSMPRTRRYVRHNIGVKQKIF